MDIREDAQSEVNTVENAATPLHISTITLTPNRHRYFGADPATAAANQSSFSSAALLLSWAHPPRSVRSRRTECRSLAVSVRASLSAARGPMDRRRIQSRPPEDVCVRARERKNEGKRVREDERVRRVGG